MKALGYFAVVTGKGAANSKIQEIKDYEEKFFSNSKIFKYVSHLFSTELSVFLTGSYVIYIGLVSSKLINWQLQILVKRFLNVSGRWWENPSSNRPTLIRVSGLRTSGSCASFFYPVITSTATRFNLETEWKNNYPRVRELDRVRFHYSREIRDLTLATFFSEWIVWKSEKWNFRWNIEPG